MPPNTQTRIPLAVCCIPFPCSTEWFWSEFCRAWCLIATDYVALIIFFSPPSLGSFKPQLEEAMSILIWSQWLTLLWEGGWVRDLLRSLPAWIILRAFNLTNQGISVSPNNSKILSKRQHPFCCSWFLTLCSRPAPLMWEGGSRLLRGQLFSAPLKIMLYPQVLMAAVH